MIFLQKNPTTVTLNKQDVSQKREKVVVWKDKLDEAVMV